jgi:hypothetical protein
MAWPPPRRTTRDKLGRLFDCSRSPLKNQTAEEIRDLILEAAQSIPVEQLATTDDSGFALFDDERCATRDYAFEKIRRRVIGTALATEEISGGKLSVPRPAVSR